MNTQKNWRRNEHHLVGDMIGVISLSPKAIAKVKVANSFWATP